MSEIITQGSRRKPAKRSMNNRRYELKRDQDDGLRQARAIRDSGRWQKVRDLQKKRHPLCFDPFGIHESTGVVTPMDQVHHIKGLRTHPGLAFVASNLASLCVDCHSRIENLERTGTETQELFKGGGG